MEIVFTEAAIKAAAAKAPPLSPTAEKILEGQRHHRGLLEQLRHAIKPDWTDDILSRNQIKVRKANEQCLRKLFRVVS